MGIVYSFYGKYKKSSSSVICNRLCTLQNYSDVLWIEWVRLFWGKIERPCTLGLFTFISCWYSQGHHPLQITGQKQWLWSASLTSSTATGFPWINSPYNAHLVTSLTKYTFKSSSYCINVKKGLCTCDATQAFLYVLCLLNLRLSCHPSSAQQITDKRKLFRSGTTSVTLPAVPIQVWSCTHII